MKLDRNLDPSGRGKYALLKLRVARSYSPQAAQTVLAPHFEGLKVAGVLDWGVTPETEFMVIRLKDKYAQAALRAYANAARADDPEYAAEIDEMAARSGPNSPFCKRPD